MPTNNPFTVEMSPNNRQYILEVIFRNGKDQRENHYVIMEEESMTDFSKLRQDLKKICPEPFVIQYIDDENDNVCVDTEEEFLEFHKFAKERVMKNMLINLILDMDPVLVNQCSYRQSENTLCMAQTYIPSSTMPNLGLGLSSQPLIKSLEKLGLRSEIEIDKMTQVHIPSSTMPNGGLIVGSQPSVKSLEKKLGLWSESEIDKLKQKIKDDVKREILSEMGVLNEASTDVPSKDFVEYEEDSDGGNVLHVIEKRRAKLLHNQKRLESKEKLMEAKLDQRLEKLELKKKKLLEKAAYRATVCKPMEDQPRIMSVLHTTDVLPLPKKVLAGKVFRHSWHVINDGTCAWKQVELHHTWSTPGLEPAETIVKCSYLLPGQQDQIVVKFKAPKSVGPFVSYWHFFHLESSQWQQFGHYLSVSGSTKLPEYPHAAPKKLTEAIKKLKQQTKTVTFTEGAGTSSAAGVAKEEKILNDEAKMAYQIEEEATKKQLANLASSEIAAEMAKVANAAYKQKVQTQSKIDNFKTKMDKLDKSLEETEKLVEELDLMEHSGSDNDADDTMDESVRDFVLVDIQTCNISDSTNPSKRFETLTDPLVVEKEMNKTDTEKNVLGKTTHSFNLTENEVYGGADELEKEAETFHRARLGDIMMTSPGTGTALTSPVIEEGDEVHFTVKQSEPSVDSFNSEPLLDKYNYERMKDPQQPLDAAECEVLHIPPIGDDVQQVPKMVDHKYHFVPSPQRPMMAPVYPPHPMTHQHNPHCYPVFPPQNSTSHHFALPPPPVIIKAHNVPLHYTQIPSYPPMTGSSHPIPLISAGPLPPPPAIPTQPPISFPPQIPHNLTAPYLNHPMHSHAFEHTNGLPVSVTPISSTTTQPLGFPVTTPQPPNMTVTAEPHYSASTPVVPTADQIQQKQNPTDKNKKTESGVQILPQALVDGAINVASTAYSTAWNALNHLRPKEGEATEFDPLFENNMAALMEMGFNNMERNTRLLKRYNNDINQVISAICANGGGNLEID